MEYGVGAPVVAYLLWRGNSGAHQLTMAPVLAIIVYLQTPGIRRLYPSTWNRARPTLHREH